MNSPPGARTPTAVLALVLLAAAVPRVFVAWTDQGLFWPDEIFQSLEQAHRFAFGYGLVPWEFRLGARSWVFPGALGLWLKLCALVGLDSAPALVRAAKLAMVGLSLGALAASMGLARAFAGRTALLVAGLLGASFPAATLFSARTMNEMASAALLTGAAFLALTRPSRWALVGAGVLAGLSVFTRYQTGLVAALLLLPLLWGRRWRDALTYGLALAGVGLLGGLLDAWTWGKPFHSFIEYVNFNFIQGRASEWGVSPPHYYLRVLWQLSPEVFVLLGVGLVSAVPRAFSLVMLTVVFVGIHSFIPHKELRFLMPILPIAFAAAAVGLTGLAERLRAQKWVVPVAVLAALACAVRTPRLTFATLGQFEGQPAASLSAWGYGDGLSRMLWSAGAREDACGVVFHDIRHWSPGYSYLHREIPTVWGLNLPNAQAANYVVSHRLAQVPPPYSQVDAHGDYALYRRDGPCAPNPPGFSWFMPGP